MAIISKKEERQLIRLGTYCVLGCTGGLVIAYGLLRVVNGIHKLYESTAEDCGRAEGYLDGFRDGLRMGKLFKTVLNPTPTYCDDPKEK